MNRVKHLALADAAVIRAERLADIAETLARSPRRDEADPLAAAGALWAKVARAHAAIAAATPETTTED